MKCKRIFGAAICTVFVFRGISFTAVGAVKSRASKAYVNETSETTTEAPVETTTAYREIAVPEETIAIPQTTTVSPLTEGYNYKTGKYTETFGSGRQFVSTVPNGGKVYDGVILSIPSDISASLYRDGTNISFSSGQAVYGKGYYTLNLTSTDVISGEKVTAIFTFRILGTPVKSGYNSTYSCGETQCVNSISYDDTMGMYAFTFPNYKRVYTDLTGYSTNVESAMFVFPADVGYELKKNGSAVSVRSSQTITAAGDYTLTVYAKNYGTGDYETVYKTTIDFTIGSNTEDTFDDVLSYVFSSNQGTSGTAGTAAGDYTSSSQTAESSAVDSNVIDDMLREVYNEEAQLYSETFSSGDVFYTNTANGDVCGGNVYIDIPSNMYVVMTKDGLSATYTNKKYINEEGSYVLIITDIFADKSYRARYSFRIQNGAEMSQGGAEDVVDLEASELDIDFLELEEDNSLNVEYDEETKRFAYSLGGETFYSSLPSGVFTGNPVELDIPDSLTAALTKDGEEYAFTERLEETGTYELAITSLLGTEADLTFYLYDRAVNSLESYSAPSGYTITYLNYTDYKGTYTENQVDGQEADPAEAQEEAAEDAAEATDATAEEAAEETDNAAEDNSVNEAKALIAAQETRASGGGLKTIKLPLDGSYEIMLEGEGMPNISSEILIDRTAPELVFDGLNAKMKSTGTTVTVSCDDEEATLVLYSKSGDQTVLGESGGTFNITGVGTYVVRAYDPAGNITDVEFKLVRHIGAAGVGAIVMFFLLVACIVGYIIYNSKKFAVR